MPIRRSVHAYRAATPFEQAAWMLALIPAAVVVPVLLRWTLGSIADAGRGQAGVPAAVTRMTLRAAGELVHWMGIGILAGLAALCAALMVASLRDARGRSAGIPGWAVADTYLVGTMMALAGLLWLL